MFVRPDWKDAEAYRVIESASLARIAWEFLRRNPEYHEAWKRYAESVRSIAAADAEVARYAEFLLSASPTREMAESLGGDARISELHGRLSDEFGFLAEVPGKPGRKSRLDHQYGVQWGLVGMPHPARSYSMMNIRFANIGDSVRSPTSHGLRILEDESGTRGSLTESKWLVLQIDLSLPLEVIESAVMREIKDEREFRAGKGFIEPERSRALAKSRYVEYLRILDGAAAGVLISEIGQCIAPRANNSSPDKPRDKRFRAALNEAKRLQADGYRVLPLLQKTDPVRKKK